MLACHCIAGLQDSRRRYDERKHLRGDPLFTLLRNAYNFDSDDLLPASSDLAVFVGSRQKGRSKGSASELARMVVHLCERQNIVALSTGIVPHGVIKPALREGTDSAQLVQRVRQYVALTKERGRAPLTPTFVTRHFDKEVTVNDVDGLYRDWPMVSVRANGASKVLNPYRINISLRNMQRTVELTECLTDADTRGAEVVVLTNAATRFLRYARVLDMTPKFIRRLERGLKRGKASAASKRGVEASGGVELSADNYAAWVYAFSTSPVHFPSADEQEDGAEAAVDGNDFSDGSDNDEGPGSQSKMDAHAKLQEKLLCVTCSRTPRASDR